MRYVSRSGRVMLKAGGYTLVELMVTLAIVAILGTLAAPALQSLNTKIKLQGVGSQFNGHLLRARSEAVNRNACTVMCLSTTTSAAITSDNFGNLTAGPSCANAGSNWQQGWIVFLKDDCSEATANAADNRPARPEDYIAVQAPIASDYRLDAKGGTPNRLFFRSSGRPSVGAPAEFDLYYQTANSATTQKYGYNTCVDAFGRTRTISWNATC